MVFGTFLDSFFRGRSSACSRDTQGCLGHSRTIDLRPRQNGATFKKLNSRRGNSPCLVPQTHLIIQPQLKHQIKTPLVCKKGCKGTLQASNQAWYRRQPEYQGASSWEGGGAPKKRDVIFSWHANHDHASPRTVAYNNHGSHSRVLYGHHKTRWKRNGSKKWREGWPGGFTT